MSDAKEWLIKMQQIDGQGYSSIHTIRGVVRPAFQMAVDDELLVKNPFEFQQNTVVVNDSVTREAITRQQEREKNLDFENSRIIVDHQLQRTRDMKYIIEDTKTESGERMVPMTSEVKEAFQRILANRKNPKIEPVPIWRSPV